MSSRPLRIAMLGWARLSLGEREGSGYNLCVSELAAELVRRGHYVCYLRSGMAYDAQPAMHIESAERWRGVQCFELVNSPNIATGYQNFRNVLSEISSPLQSELVTGWLASRRVEVAHVHSIEGFSLDLLGAMRRCGLRVVVTPHNYFYLCQQVDLLHDERKVCEDYDGGLRCERCMDWPDPTAEMARRRLPSRPDPQQRGDPVAADIGGPSVPVSPLLPVVPQHDHAEAIVQAGTTHLRVLNSHGSRRVAGIEALNHAHAVLCPGRTLMRIHEAMGVEHSRLVHVVPGQPHFDQLRSRAQAELNSARAWRPTDERALRLAFLGNTKLNKGVATLIEAIERLPASAHERLRVDIHASGEDGWCRQRMERYPNVRIHGGYSLSSLWDVLSAADAVVFPNRGLDNAPYVVLESLHAGTFVIASRLGASIDLIRTPETGVLFEPGDPNALARTLLSILDGTTPIASRGNVLGSCELPTHAEYVNDVERAVRNSV